MQLVVAGRLGKLINVLGFTLLWTLQVGDKAVYVTCVLPGSKLLGHRHLPVLSELDHKPKAVLAESSRLKQTMKRR